MLFPKLLKISVLYVLEKKVLATKEASSIVSSLASCAKAVISQTTMALEENLSTATSSKMRTSF